MLRIALVADELTGSCLQHEATVLHVTPLNYRWLLRMRRPDVLFVESAWQGLNNSWKYRVAAYPDEPRRTNRALANMVSYARDLGIPTVFWNKEDGVHFERFIDSAKLFEHIFTVDENSVPRYRSLVPATTTVNTLLFPVQPATHHFSGFDFKHWRANFVGSYSTHIHGRRRVWQHMLFEAACKAGLGLTIVDRNSGRRSGVYRYPALPDMEARPAVPHARTAQIYKDYLVSLNVNTVEDSATMYSRRLIEILACGGIAVTNPSPAVERYFGQFCHVVRDAGEASALFERLRSGPSRPDLERARAGAEYVLREHTWRHRLEEMAAVVGL